MRALAEALRGMATAPKELIEFEYRKLFGLSYQELMDEPLDTYRINVDIIKLKNQVIDELARRRERQLARRR